MVAVPAVGVPLQGLPPVPVAEIKTVSNKLPPVIFIVPVYVEVVGGSNEKFTVALVIVPLV